MDKLNALLPRSGSSLFSLHLGLDSAGAKQMLGDVISAVHPHAHRLAYLRITVHDTTYVAWIMDDLSFPNLRALCVQHGDNMLGAWFGGSEDMPLDIVLTLTQQKTPALKRLTLTGSVQFQPEGNLSTLRTLRFWCSDIQGFVRAVLPCPNIQELDVELDYTDPNAWQVGSIAALWPAAASRAAQISAVRLKGIDDAQHSVIMTLFVSHVTRHSLVLSYADSVTDDSTEWNDAILGVFSHLNGHLVDFTIRSVPSIRYREEIVTLSAICAEGLHREVEVAVTQPGPPIIATLFDKYQSRTSVRSLTLDASLWRTFLRSCGTLPILEDVVVQFRGGPHTSTFGGDTTTTGAPSVWPGLRTLKLVGVENVRPVLIVQTVLLAIRTLDLPHKMQSLHFERIDLLGPLHEFAQMDVAQQIFLPRC
ncbi:hypothetical protein EXIGLDRAFT_752846 [Exidia glandulosa HHB12029]|uniref:F-box domain-containing protein n=1 Tax=Exidia glandulosa HHB12029 TaxID=1314781 RepID=A0A165E917_EXIGL|nr:hypothetical protein EXIGLDRAFT_752846 [Exidia glandulosa HHB12029]